MPPMNQLLEDGGNESWFSDYAGVILTSIAVFLVIACKFQFTLHLSLAHCVRGVFITVQVNAARMCVV